MIGLCTLSIGDGRTSNFITSHAKSNRSLHPARSQQEKPSPSPHPKPTGSSAIIAARWSSLKAHHDWKPLTSWVTLFSSRLVMWTFFCLVGTLNGYGIAHLSPLRSLDLIMVPNRSLNRERYSTFLWPLNNTWMRYSDSYLRLGWK